MTSTLPPPSARPTMDWPTWRIDTGPRLLSALLVGGAAFDLGVRHPVGAMTFLAVVGLVAASRLGRWTNPAAGGLLLLAMVFAGWTVVRASAWLVPFDLAAALALVLASAMLRTEPHALSRVVGRMSRPVPALEPAVRAVDLVADAAATSFRGRERLGTRLRVGLRGALVAIPVVATLAALLAASDAIFASALDLPLDPVDALGHGVVVMLGAALTAALAGHGAVDEVAPVAEPRPWIGSTEAAMVLGGVVIVYTGFVASQVIAILGGADYVLRTTGLTYAEYAREGFFTLLAAAVLTLLVLVVLARHVHPVAPRGRLALAVLQQATVGLTLVSVLVAIRRLFLYEAEFGLTMLRLSTIVFAAWIGVVFVVVGAWLRGRVRAPLTAVVGSALVVLFAMNAVNPEALVARRNVDRFGATPALDVDYLVEQLGPDAWPEILRDPTARAALCRRAEPPDDRLVVFNLGRVRGADAWRDGCG